MCKGVCKILVDAFFDASCRNLETATLPPLSPRSPPLPPSLPPITPPNPAVAGAGAEPSVNDSVDYSGWDSVGESGWVSEVDAFDLAIHPKFVKKYGHVP